MYKGRFILRFEDTDPRLKKSALEYYDQIREDLRWLGCEWDEEVIQSDRLAVYYDHAAKLISQGGAYVCQCSPESFRAHIAKSAACPHRNLGVNEQLGRWERMLGGGYAEGGAVVRVKTDLGHPNPAVRDWPALRIIDPAKHPHPRVGSKFRVWPLYNFAAGIDDHLLRVTHILRGKDHLTNTERQKYMYAHLGWEYPEAIHYGRLNLVEARLSKSQMMRELESGVYRSLSDPRLPTFAALRRRGIQAAAIQRMMWDIGPRPVDSSVSWEILYALNRKIVDPIAARYFFIKDPKPVEVSGLPESKYSATLTLHPGRRDSLTRTIGFESPSGVATLLLSGVDLELAHEGSELRLMDLFNIRFTRVSPEKTSAIRVSDPYEEARRAGMQLIHWLPKEQATTCEVSMPSGETAQGLVEKNITRVKVGEVVQFVRFGFARLDELSDSRVVAYFAHT
jgi:glutamyl-tRNA synthetase